MLELFFTPLGGSGGMPPFPHLGCVPPDAAGQQAGRAAQVAGDPTAATPFTLTGPRQTPGVGFFVL